jgi:DNA polymerase III delta prime subunit
MWSPTHIEKTICLHPSAEEQIGKWLDKPSHPAVLLYGEPGVGKTTLAHRAFRKQNLKIIEFNASHTRSGTSFRKIILPLLKEGGIVNMLETGKKGGIGIILDEIDGLSQGEKGGLKELLDFLRSWKPTQEQTTPLVLISNTLDSRNLIQISKLCLTIAIREADKLQVEKWLGHTLQSDDSLANVQGDLRLLQRQVAGLEQPCESSEVPEGILPIAWWTLWTEWDPFVNLDIESHEANLAGLVMVENMNDRIKASLGDTEESWNLYGELYRAYCKSDRADFWAFFHQCWNLLPLSQDLKLKIPSLQLSQHCKLDESARIPKPDALRYTPVLTKQSAIFNSWKFMCELADRDGVPVHTIPSLCHLEALKPEIKADKQRRLRNIALQTLLEDN